MKNCRVVQKFQGTCYALINWVLIFTLYEAFYFQHQFYTKNLLDDDLKKFVNEIDINDKMSLVNQILNYSENEKLILSKALSAKEFYLENISDNKIINLYKKLFKKSKIYEKFIDSILVFLLTSIGSFCICN